MNPNSYRVKNDNEVDAADIAALLDELRDVGGTLEVPKGSAGGRSLSGGAVRRGIVGGTSVLKDQQHHGTAGLGLSLHRQFSGNNGDGTVDRRHPISSVAAGALAATGFSTYDTAEAALMDAQLQQQMQPQLFGTPLGVRLAPLAGHSGADNRGSDIPSSAFLPPTPLSQPHPPVPPPDSSISTRPVVGPAAAAGATHRFSINSLVALPPLPTLANRTPNAAHIAKDGETNTSTAASVAGGGTPGRLRIVSTGGADASALLSGGSCSPISGQQAGCEGSSGSGNGSAPHEINFLPVMCARYLRPVGLTPTARWGHTLTPINPDTMLLFGGIDANGTETASLIAFNPTTISWEPLYSMTETPVGRHSHAACAYDGRFLVISGGVAQHGGHVLDDIYLYDTYTHRWRCVWNGAQDGSPQNRNEPGPRFGHSVLLHEDRLFLYGGKTLPLEDTAGAGVRRGGSATNSPSKAASHNAATPVTTAAAILAGGSDVYVFSLNSFRWRRRLHCGKGRRSLSVSHAADGGGGVAANSADLNAAGEEQEGHTELPTRPAARANHAACVRGTTMFINGGADSSGVLTDTWSVELTTGTWRCVHRGGTADAVPREKHALFVCGEALLLVGGCSGGSGLAERITGKFTNFAVVLPLVGGAVEVPCWIPVAMGNLSIVSPSKKSFGAALSGGFVYVFGGVCGSEPAANTMIRFLAADGCISQNDQLMTQVGRCEGTSGAAAAAGAQQLRLMMQQLREQQRGTPYDIYAYAGTHGSVSDVTSVVAQLPAPWAGAPSEDAKGDSGPMAGNIKPVEDVARRSDIPIVGLHRAIVQQRAPLFLQELERCRSGLCCVGSGANTGPTSRSPQRREGSASASDAPHNNSNADASGDEVDALLRRLGGDNNIDAVSPPQLNSTLRAGEDEAGRNRSGGTAAAGGLPVYFTNGTARVPGLTQPLTAEALQCLADYIYWGGLKGMYRVLLEEKDEAEAGGGHSSNGAAESGNTGGFSSEFRNPLVQTLQTVKAAAEAYRLAPLHELCTSLLSRSREAMRLARQRCSEQLRTDLAALLSSPASANATMLVVDPHTKATAAHVLHTSVLMASSGLFTELLRPLYRASAGFANSKASNQVGPLAAKLSATAAQSPTTLLTSTSKRTVLIGPVPLPLPAVRPILRYLYTQELHVSVELAFVVMLGAHQLGLTELQAMCEAIVAREEVNYMTCCTFYYLSRKYQASLLEEIALLTAVSGFAEVRCTAAYQSLSDAEKQSIDAVAAELGSSSWVPPPQPTHEIKSKAAYAARWESSALV
ncbi:hypothetical protein ABL78_1468 [Leptomonas seymouri]|uniref:BTB domain-containing protein n=1 Tax=Leptomonas seymouri TaxID=5684 RepID=A0A0N1I275_LEPSE|nr:hypothetical protein ABL78_1468 [Leptomonas seymouri]|eukprot:KPI89432.1 hypothetical protein ABL78_1468 [Leptomonas seymouri]